MTIPDFPIRPRRLAMLACLVGALGLSACSAFGPRSAEEAIRERAQARWNALLAGRFDDAYAFLSPASRSVVSPQRFKSSFGAVLSWKSAEVHKVECAQADRCIASIKVRYQPVLRAGTLGTIETLVEETWLLDAGQWWLPQGL
jgi:hypothetical protein